MDIKPGQKVAVEIKKAPTGEAARKTLLRVCGKDAEVAKCHRTMKRKRPSLQMWQRGGRQWRHRMKTRSPVQLTAGAKYAVLATVDVIRDLQSVDRWVDVKPA